MQSLTALLLRPACWTAHLEVTTPRTSSSRSGSCVVVITGLCLGCGGRLGDGLGLGLRHGSERFESGRDAVLLGLRLGHGGRSGLLHRLLLYHRGCGGRLASGCRLVAVAAFASRSIGVFNQLRAEFRLLDIGRLGLLIFEDPVDEMQERVPLQSPHVHLLDELQCLLLAHVEDGDPEVSFPLVQNPAQVIEGSPSLCERPHCFFTCSFRFWLLWRLT